VNLAQRLGWTRSSVYAPAAFAVTAFAVGVQTALVYQAAGGTGYPPTGRGALAWGTLVVLTASAILHVPPGPIGRALAGAWNELADATAERAVVLEPHPDARPATRSLGGTNGASEVSRLSARVHSPLAAGPEVAPDETLPVTVEAEPGDLARELEVTFEIHGPSRSRTVHRSMDGTRLVEGLAFEGTGRFQVRVGLEHPHAEPVGETLEGEVVPYREAIGQRFEALKGRLADHGLDVGPQSTPREVCEELGRVDAADPGDLADLAVELEIALYGDDPVERASYETVYTTLKTLDLPEREEVRE
jgi:hypothetical protein